MKRWQKIVAVAVGTIVVVVLAASLILDSVLSSKAREQAQELSRQWDRPVRIGSVSTKFLTGLGARVSDLQIGAARGEDVPLVALQDVSVRVGLIQALFSLGKSVEVHSAEVRGLTVEIERLPDGTTNLERFQEKLAQLPKKPEDPNKKPDLSFLRVRHAALLEGRVEFIDNAGGGSRKLGVQHLDLTIDDLRAGKPLEAVLKAAVLTDKHNLELRVKAAPLPPTLVPTPTSIVLKVDPAIDLAPLGPFLGKGIGLQAGTLAADFHADLGAAVAGGSGPTAIRGAIHAAGLRFAGAEGGRKLDVSLDTDVKADAARGDLQLDKLRLDIGPAGIAGKGSARGLNTPSPSIAGLEIVSHDLDPAVLATYYPPLRRSLRGQVAGPIGVTVRASGTQTSQALELKLDLTPVRLAIPQQMAKAAGAPMSLVAHARGAAANGGPLRFDVLAELSGADLRPGESLDKKPGDRLDVLIEGTRTTSKSSSNPDQRIEIGNLKLHAKADEAQGKGFIETKGAGAKATTQFDFQLASSHLDLDKLLLPSNSNKKSKPLDPRMFAGVSGHASARIDRLTIRKQTITDIVVDATLQNDHLQVRTARMKAFGGTMVADGTELRLAHPDQPFHVVTKLDNVALQNLVALGSDHKLLSGTFNGAIDLKGGGQKVQVLAETLAGLIEGHVLNGAFLGKDLVAGVTGPLARALPFGLAGKGGQGGATSLGKDLPFGVAIANGRANLKDPIRISTPQADLSFAGGMKLDGTLDLPGTVSLAPETVSAITGGKVKPAQPIPLSVRLVGPAWSPSLADLDLKPAVDQILKEGGAALVGKALGVDTSQAQAAAQKKAEDVQKQAQGRAAEAQKRAQSEIEAQRKKAEQEAQSRLKGIFGR